MTILEVIEKTGEYLYELGDKIPAEHPERRNITNILKMLIGVGVQMMEITDLAQAKGYQEILDLLELPDICQPE